MKYPKIQFGTVEAVWNKLGGEEGVQRFLRDELVVFEVEKLATAPTLLISPPQVIRRVKVNRNRTPQEAIDATGRVQYIDSKVVEGMPRGEGDEMDVEFFKPEAWEYTRPGYMSDDDLEKALNRRGLSNDPVAVAAANEADPSLADKMPHGTHWKDSEGKWCYATFDRWGDERGVDVDRRGSGWNDGWWFAGSRKISPQV